MTPGLDATMIGALETVEADDTDFLCISSFNHSFAIISWLPANEVATQWQRLGLAGEIISATDASQATGTADPADSNQARRIFHFRLTPKLTTNQILSELRQLLADRQVATFSIGMPPAKRTPQPNELPRAKPKEAPPSPQSSVSSNPPASPPTKAEPEEEEWQHLDQLVDDFESLDL